MAGAFRGAERPEGNVRGCGDYKERPFHAAWEQGAISCSGGRSEWDSDTFGEAGNDG